MKFLLSFLLLSVLVGELKAQELYLLTKNIDASSNSKLAGGTVPLKVGGQPTLMKKISSTNGITKIQIIQEDGKTVNKTLYISNHWLNLGSKIQKFQVDPNKIVESINPLNCNPPKTTKFNTANACEILETNNEDMKGLIKCYEHLQNKLNMKSTDSAYESLSKLYGLSNNERKFLAVIYTMYGEARGTRPPELQMAAVMKVISNRTKYAQRKRPQADELDVVLQDTQFSAFNTTDPNWKHAIMASPQSMERAISVYAKRNSTYRCEEMSDKVWHYAETTLCQKGKVYWYEESKVIKAVVNGQEISEVGAHRFLENVAWTFSSTNKYKTYAKQKGIIK